MGRVTVTTPSATVATVSFELVQVNVYEAFAGSGVSTKVNDSPISNVCVVLASDGYPLAYEKGLPITGFEQFEGKEDYFCFHAGTKFDENGQIVTNGGRVLGITATGADLKEARAKAYAATEWISFANKYKRNDIGKAIDSVQ